MSLTLTDAIALTIECNGGAKMMSARLFPAGLILATPGASKALEEAGQDARQFLARHLRGDWGDLCPEDVAENAFSLRRKLRLMSTYTLPTGVKLWIITEADRSATTLLLPEEY